MNIHHLELFYYVAKHGGISEAVRNIPYGIQQPAVSGQLIQLEESLGVTLFHRRPFALTAPGKKLFGFVQPFFENLSNIEEEIRGGISHQIRIGASEIVLRDYLPGVLQIVRREFPRLKVILREGYQPDLEQLLEKQEIDLAVTLLEGKASPAMKSKSLVKLPLVLLTSKESTIKTAQDLWSRDRIEEPLISLPRMESIYKRFQEGLARLKVDWFTSIEVSTVELVETYVANGYGIGLSIAIPGVKRRGNVRTLPLEGFAPVDFGVLWKGEPTPLMQKCLDTIEQTANLVLGKMKSETD